MRFIYSTAAACRRDRQFPPCHLLRLLRLLRSLIVLAALSSSGTALAAAEQCNKISDIASDAPGFRPPLRGKVIGTGRAKLNFAPHAQCGTKQFLIPGDTVTVYTVYEGWASIMYINSKTGEDVEAWIEESRLQLPENSRPAQAEQPRSKAVK